MTKNDIAEIVGASELMIDGERVDRRSITARRWCSSFADLAMQIGGVTLSEAMMLRRTANLAMMCERDEARVMSTTWWMRSTIAGTPLPQRPH
ncbi:hypothetical protein [Methylobacterium bullatum]|uniref:hypothetical protein n=1 Tax=Methylobacterium bullatum TaxID=570505 RepID=UPI0030CE4F05